MFRFVSFMKFEMYEVQSESEAYLYNMIFLAQGSNERALEGHGMRGCWTPLCQSYLHLCRGADGGGAPSYVLLRGY